MQHNSDTLSSELKGDRSSIAVQTHRFHLSLFPAGCQNWTFSLLSYHCYSGCRDKNRKLHIDHTTCNISQRGKLSDPITFKADMFFFLLVLFSSMSFFFLFCFSLLFALFLQLCSFYFPFSCISCYHSSSSLVRDQTLHPCDIIVCEKVKILPQCLLQ